MLSANRTFRVNPAFRPAACGWAALLLAGMLSRWAAAADAPAPPPEKKDAAAAESSQGLFVTVPNPIDSKAVKRVTAPAQRFLDRPDRRRLKIVLDFNPDGHPASTPDF